MSGLEMLCVWSGKMVVEYMLVHLNQVCIDCGYSSWNISASGIISGLTGPGQVGN